MFWTVITALFASLLNWAVEKCAKKTRPPFPVEQLVEDGIALADKDSDKVVTTGGEDTSQWEYEGDIAAVAPEDSIRPEFYHSMHVADKNSNNCVVFKYFKYLLIL